MVDRSIKIPTQREVFWEIVLERDELRGALMTLVDALHVATPDGPVKVGRAEEEAIRVLARPGLTKEAM